MIVPVEPKSLVSPLVNAAAVLREVSFSFITTVAARKPQSSPGLREDVFLGVVHGVEGLSCRCSLAFVREGEREKKRKRASDVTCALCESPSSIHPSLSHWCFPLTFLSGLFLPRPHPDDLTFAVACELGDWLLLPLPFSPPPPLVFSPSLHLSIHKQSQGRSTELLPPVSSRCAAMKPSAAALGEGGGGALSVCVCVYGCVFVGTRERG